MKRTSWLAAAAALLLFLTLFAIASAARAESAPGVAATVPAPKLDWHPCEDPAQNGFQCATARVPRSYRRPHRRKINLAVIRHRVRDPAHRIGTLFYNPGGPGGRGTTTLPETFGVFPAALRARFDLVSWDPRGVGASTAIKCFDNTEDELRFLDGAIPSQSFPVGEAEESTWIRRWARFGRRCARRDGTLLRHVSTADTARDLNLLRRAVGDRRLNYYGASYGTVLGATYANLFPHRVRAMALDGNLNPKEWVRRRVKGNGGSFLDTYLRQHADRGAVRTLNAFLDLCGRNGTARCAFSAGSPTATRTKYAALLRRLRTSPQGADATYAEVVSATGNALYAPAAWPDLARRLQELWTTGTTSRPLTPAPVPGLPPATSGQAAGAGHVYEGAEQNLAIKCSESPNPRPGAFRSLDAFAYERSGPLGRWWSWQSEPCASWPATATDRYAGPWDRRTANPVLVIGNTHDPATPYRGAKAMARQLARARLLTLDGYGHVSGADPSACVFDALAAYLIHLRTPRRGAVCQPDRVPFDPDFGQPLP